MLYPIKIKIIEVNGQKQIILLSTMDNANNIGTESGNYPYSSHSKPISFYSRELASLTYKINFGFNKLSTSNQTFESHFESAVASRSENNIARETRFTESARNARLCLSNDLESLKNNLSTRSEVVKEAKLAYANSSFHRYLQMEFQHEELLRVSHVLVNSPTWNI